jgi:hypothetical protein
MFMHDTRQRMTGFFACGAFEQSDSACFVVRVCVGVGTTVLCWSTSSYSSVDLLKYILVMICDRNRGGSGLGSARGELKDMRFRGIHGSNIITRTRGREPRCRPNRLSYMEILLQLPYLRACKSFGVRIRYQTGNSRPPPILHSPILISGSESRRC